MQAIPTILGVMGLAFMAAAQTPAVTIESPEADASVFYSVPVRVQAVGVDWLTLWLDGKPIVSLREPPYAWTLDMLDQSLGPHQIEIEYAHGGTIRRVERNVMRTPDIPDEQLPAEGLPRWGATVGKGGLVTFVLDAPAARFVSLLGDFNQWNPATDVMIPTGDGRWWMRKTLRERESLFQYMVDGDVKLADPFSREVQWKGKDPTTAKTRIRPLPRRPYAWSDRAFKRPNLRDLVVYEMAMGDATINRGFRALSLHLRYVKKLGANAIELMPLTEYPGEALKGHDPAFPFALENSYGTPRDLKDFVNRAHAQGIAVILDMALHQRTPSEDEVEAVLEYWIREFHIDGIRYHRAQDLEWKDLSYIADVEDPGLFQLADHRPPDPAMVQDTFLDALWDNNLSERFRKAIRTATLDPAWVKSVLDAGEAGYQRAEQRVLFVENHDQERLFRLLREEGYTDNEVVRRVGLAHAILLTVPGVVLLHAGQELGVSRPNTEERAPLDLGQANRPPYRSMHQQLRALITLRHKHPACRQDKIRLLKADAGTGVLVYQRHAPGTGIVVAANFSKQERKVQIPLPIDWQWHDVFSAKDLTFANETGVLLTLAPGQARVLTMTAPANK